MIQLKEPEEAKKERPVYFGSNKGKAKTYKKKAAPKKKLSEQMAELRANREDTAPQEVQHEEGKNYVFKSKFREDVVNLIRPQKKQYADGSTFIDPGFNAEFHRNTWSTDNPTHAQILRDKIKERQDHDPLHIVETTQV